VILTTILFAVILLKKYIKITFTLLKKNIT